MPRVRQRWSRVVARHRWGLRPGGGEGHGIGVEGPSLNPLVPTDVDRKVVMTDTTAQPTTAPREVRLAARPVGWPTHDDFAVVESELPQIADGQLRVRNLAG